MRKAFIISLSGHILILFSLWSSCGKKVSYIDIPQIYEVELIAMPQIEEPPPEEPVPDVDVETIPPPPEEKKKIKPKKKETEPKQQEQQKQAIGSQQQQSSATVRSDELFEFPWYLRLMTDKISRNWRNPYRGEEESVLCTIYFRIIKNGTVNGMRLEKSSGISAFDRAALRAVASSSPLPHLPPDYAEPHLTVHLDFEYRKK